MTVERNRIIILIILAVIKIAHSNDLTIIGDGDRNLEFLGKSNGIRNSYCNFLASVTRFQYRLAKKDRRMAPESQNRFYTLESDHVELINSYASCWGRPHVGHCCDNGL